LKALNGEGRQLVSQAVNDHKDINDLLMQISRLKLTAKNFDDRFEALFEIVDQHVEEEEGEIFRFAEENCSQQQLEDLGRQIQERKRILDRQLAA
jgi:hemerythrin superfamily protein